MADSDKNILSGDLIGQAVRALGYGDEVELTEEENFVRNSLAWLARSVREDSAKLKVSTDPALFVYAPAVRAADVLTGGVPAPSFRKTSSIAFPGHVHICSENLEQVYRAPRTFSDVAAAIHAFYTSAELQDASAGVIFEPNSLSAYVVLRTTNSDDAVKLTFPEKPEPFSFDNLGKYLERFHEKGTRYSEGRCRIWKDLKTRMLKETAEVQIQGVLVWFLEYEVGTAGLVDEEVRTTSGRSDVRMVLWPKDGGPERRAILELKVLRAQWSATRNVAWAKKGVNQVVRYRGAQKNVTHGFACCFDGRKKNDPMPEFETYANAKNVVAKRFFMAEKEPG
jgi:hypothetical protein